MRLNFSVALIAAASSFVAWGADELPRQYREPFAKSWPIRKQQHLQMKDYLDKFKKRSEQPNPNSFALDFSSVSAYESSLLPIRSHLERVRDLPPPEAKEHPEPRFELVGEDSVARIYRVWVEAFAGVETYALYMVPRVLEGPAPVIVAVHGGSGCPEAICDLDTRINYRSFGHEAVKRGYIVYAPGLLMAVSYANPPDPRIAGADYQALGEQAAALGTSTRDLQIYQIIAGTQAVVDARPEADAARIGMTGLSMGGSFTLATMSVWPAIKAGVCSAGFRARNAETLTGQLDSIEIGRRTPQSAMVAMICPRPLMIQTGAEDTVVELPDVKRGIPQARGYYERLGISDRFEFNVHAGGHVFENEALFRFFDSHLR
jgi:dienelactone hydrolase